MNLPQAACLIVCPRVITGSCDEANVNRISQVEGVAHVETQQKYQIAPPQSEIEYITPDWG